MTKLGVRNLYVMALETFALPRREIAAFRDYQQLSRDFVEVNEKICRMRPVEDTLTPEEKKRPKRSSKK